ncbi:hypothetical protein SSCI18S_01027 [Sphingobium scionense]
MTKRRFSDVGRMIHDLLDRHEMLPHAISLRAYVDEEAFSSVEARDRFLQALKAAEATGGLRIKQTRDKADIAHVRLAEPAALYAHVGRRPARSDVDARLATIRARAGPSAQMIALLEQIAESWARGVGCFGLTPHDVTGLADALELVQALAARMNAGDASLIDYRSFSRSAGTDSKALERLTPIVARLFAYLHPDHAPEGSWSPKHWLTGLGVVRMPQPLLLSGSLMLGDQSLPRLSYYGIPPEQAADIALAGPVAYVLTIENYVSFVRHVREINANLDALIIYTGGFPSHAHLQQIVRLAAAADAPLLHWGDMDGGGIRIFRHLEKALADHGLRLHPHLMDSATLIAQGVPRAMALRKADAPPADSAIYPLWEVLANYELMLEQESLTPHHPNLRTASGRNAPKR